MSRKVKYNWQEEIGLASCVLFYKNLSFCGQAHCHPDDKDMCSELTGCYLAEQRATKKVLQYIKENELKPQLQALKQLYYSMNHSKHFNPKSYEAKMLFHQINGLEKDLCAVREAISDLDREVKQYIEDKDKLHTRIRRAKQVNQTN